MENQENNKFLGEEKISKLLLKFSIPCIISLLISSLYNIVDQIFIGNSSLGYLGNAATGVVFPITIIAVALPGVLAMEPPLICHYVKEEVIPKTPLNQLAIIF